MSRQNDLEVARAAWETGLQETREVLQAVRRSPWTSTRAWIATSLAIAVVLLSAALIISLIVPGSGDDFLPITTDPDAGAADFAYLLMRNGTVLLLHLLVCFASYLARRSLPMQAEQMQGVTRWVHLHAGTWALVFVAGATVFSLSLQAWVLGNDLATAAQSLQMSTPGLLARLLVHGIPELAAVFLPLAATLVLARRKQFNALLAATLISACMAVPVLMATAAMEVWVTRVLF